MKNIGDYITNDFFTLAVLQGKQQVVHGDAAQCSSSPGQPNEWTHINRINHAMLPKWWKFKRLSEYDSSI